VPRKRNTTNCAPYQIMIMSSTKMAPSIATTKTNVRSSSGPISEACRSSGINRFDAGQVRRSGTPKRMQSPFRETRQQRPFYG
jgi:hypothetical protein